MTDVIDVVRDAIAAGIAEVTPTGVTPTASGYGIDLVCVNDLTDDMAEAGPTDLHMLGQDAFHRVTTPRGTLEDDKDYGIDLAGLLSHASTAEDILATAGQAESELLKDDRLDAATVTIVASTDYESFAVSIELTPVDSSESFTLVVAVTSGVALLEEIQQ